MFPIFSYGEKQKILPKGGDMADLVKGKYVTRYM